MFLFLSLNFECILIGYLVSLFFNPNTVFVHRFWFFMFEFRMHFHLYGGVFFLTPILFRCGSWVYAKVWTNHIGYFVCCRYVSERKS